MLSCLTGHWKHTLGNVAMIGAMLLTIWLSPILWRQQFLMMCGGLGLLMLPDRRPWQTVLTSLVMIVWMQKAASFQCWELGMPELISHQHMWGLDSTFVNGHEMI
eukprot:symbB.v1.2.011956.t1/scaffold816.1/size160128/2